MAPRSPAGAASEAGAAEHLRYIRDVMGRSATFTAVPGWGAVAMGVMGLAAAALAAPRVGTAAWLYVWLGAAVVAVGVGGAALVRKARRHGVPLASGAGRKYVASLLPPFVAAALLTAALRIAFRAGTPYDAAPGGPADPSTAAGDALLPGLWLLLYGAGTVAGGAFAIRAFLLVGAAFMGLGALALGAGALGAPLAWGNVLLGLGFGGLHIALGAHIVRNHGG